MRPFQIDVPQADLDDLRARLLRTRWPEPATEDGWAQGVPLDYARDLSGYWANAYDWRRCEAELNARSQHLVPVDGGGTDTVDVHVLEAPSPHPGALPLLLTHGWPGSVVEFLDVLDALADPPEPADAFHVVVASLPGFGFSGKPAVAGWGVERIARAWVQLMAGLDHRRWGAHGGDWGAMVTAELGTLAPSGMVGVHVTMPLVRRPDTDDLTPDEEAAMADYRRFAEDGSAYAVQQATRPQTVGYGLADSPVGQLAWVVEKFHAWTDNDGSPEDAVERDRLLDNVMLYWLPDAAAASARIYRESYGRRRLDPVPVPSGVTIFPRDLHRPPRRWVERRFTDLRHWSAAPRGGHFAALEEPGILVEELRAFFREVR
jgi:pimeloyl-ACP methyl ester carboxylesterase